ncbi:ParB/RepB/Spo0J family partition protein [Nostoc sp. FACHB-110]|uniref:ParB/RepB/Spo0J family partition protein n=1 Tax=Nostoc sp. FACHB-110 TaxID=2692834 RepID=UPI001688DA3A|nr:ParB/RepB/Spo0J family partition protein [Nostoc sp. FACHB-110]MBD2435616.1 ParB/RepB/Spo0J family partition protein [Nostoc sp. FACHB-110]
MLSEKIFQLESDCIAEVKRNNCTKQYITTVSIDDIRLPAQQPRRYFDHNKLIQLIQSVKKHGILEPLLVRPLNNGEYELVAGERRIRAAREAGLIEVPIVVMELDEKQALQVALIENLQREELNAVEETEAVLELLSLSLEISIHDVISLIHLSFNAKQRCQSLNQNALIQIAKIESILAEIGKFNAGSFRSSRLPLLNLPIDILSVLRRGEIEYTKAQAIARVKSEQKRAELLKVAIAEDLSLSEIKKRIQALKAESNPHPKNTVTDRFKELNKLLQKKNALINPQNREKITQLLDELEQIIAKS